MMANVFSNPRYQHMVNETRTMFYTMQSDLINKPDYMLLGKTVCRSGIMNRMPPDIGMQLMGEKSPKSVPNWSLILYEFLPRNKNSRTHKKRRNCQYKPVVLRNKTPYAQLNPQLLSHEDEPSYTLRLSRAYTLPHNKDTDVPEIRPAGDSSINGAEEEPQAWRLSRIMLDLLRRICRQSSLDELQFLARLYDFFLNIALSLRHSIMPNSLIRVKQVILVEPIAVVWRCVLNTYLCVVHYYSNCYKPLIYEAHVSQAKEEASAQNNQLNQLNQSTRELLSRSAIVSFGRYCNFESFKNLQANRQKC